MKGFIDRPTLRIYKHHQHQLRWERRLAQVPYYRLKLLGLLILGITLLLGSILVSIWLGR